MALRIGQIRTRLGIERPVDVVDAGGGRTRAWHGAGTIWAEVRPISGREMLWAGQIAGEVTHEVMIRTRSLPGAFDRTWRFVLGDQSRRLEIVSERDHEERTERTHLLCHEARDAALPMLRVPTGLVDVTCEVLGGEFAGFSAAGASVLDATGALA